MEIPFVWVLFGVFDAVMNKALGPVVIIKTEMGP